MLNTKYESSIAAVPRPTVFVVYLQPQNSLQSAVIPPYSQHFAVGDDPHYKFAARDPNKKI